MSTTVDYTGAIAKAVTSLPEAEKVKEYEGLHYSVVTALQGYLRAQKDYPTAAEASLNRLIDARRMQDEILVGLLGIDPAKLGLDPKQWRMRQ